jgi:hypothetical protein
MVRLVFVIPLIVVLVISIPLAYSQGQGGGGNQGVPKVDIFARQVGDNSILVTWENPDDTADNIVYRYSVGRDINGSENFVTLFDSLRNLEEKIVDTNGQEMFFYLDEDIQAGNTYTYLVTTGKIQGNPNPVRSDDTKPIYINPRRHIDYVEGQGHLIVGRTITPITPVISWFNWFNPAQLVSADTFVNSIFTTTLNPQNEAYRLALEPVPDPNVNETCEQILEFAYSRSDYDGQDFTVVATILEKEIIRDDNPQSYTVIETIRNQKAFDEFADSDKVRHKWFTIPPEVQTIRNFSALEVQYDVTGDFTINPLDYRTLSIWDTRFIIPDGNLC